MEKIEKTPTPREALFVIKKSLETLISDRYAFHSLISMQAEGVEIEEDELDKVIALYNDLYTETIEEEEIEDDENEDDEVVEGTNYLEILKNKLAALEIQITTSLEKNDFSALDEFIKSADKSFHDEQLESANNDSKNTIEGDIDVLNRIYKEYLDEVNKFLDRRYKEPEFDLD